MSYILDALRKSEAERKQGELPDLGSSMQIIHKPRRTHAPVVLWGVIIALLLNGAVLAWLFWPESRSRPEPGLEPSSRTERASAITTPDVPLSAAQDTSREVPEARVAPVRTETVQEAGPTGQSTQGQGQLAVAAPSPSDQSPGALPATPAASAEESATSGTVTENGTAPGQLTPPPQSADEKAGSNNSFANAVMPELGDMSVGFQRRVPELVFNSHIYSTRADARRVIINNEYLREGGQVAGLVVEEITEEGVILSLQDQSFLVPVVRNWNPPR